MLSGLFVSLTIPFMPKRKKMGRPPKKSKDRKSRYVSFPVEKSRLKIYREASKVQHKGKLARFLRDAADALSAQLGHPVAPPIEQRKPDAD